MSKLLTFDIKLNNAKFLNQLNMYTYLTGLIIAYGIPVGVSKAGINKSATSWALFKNI